MKWIIVIIFLFIVVVSFGGCIHPEKTIPPTNPATPPTPIQTAVIKSTTTPLTSTPKPTQTNPAIKYAINSEIQRNSTDSAYDKDRAWVIVKINNDGTYSIGSIYFDPAVKTWFKNMDELVPVRDFHAVERDYPNLVGNRDWNSIPQKHEVKGIDGVTRLDWVNSPDSPPSASPTYYSQPSGTFFSGSGDQVVSFTATGTGLRIFTMSYSGKSNFIVWLKDGNGDLVSLLANKIGSYSGRKSEQLSTGKYYLDVTADGPWSIQITS